MEVVSMIVLCFAVSALVVRQASAAVPARADFFVSPEGRDRWSGTLPAADAARTDGPFATLARAQEAVRKRRLAAPGQPVTVLIRGGVYTLQAPVQFGPADSGAEGAEVTYAAYPGEKPVFSGGTVITGWEKGQGNLWVAHVPQVAAGEWYFHQLFVNGRRATRARTPNGGYLHIAGPLEPLGDRTKARGDNTKKQGFRYHPGDLKRWDDLDDVNVVLYHAWTASVHWIKELDEANHLVRLTNRTGWPIAWWDAHERYHLENYREALDSPGEWYLNRKTGTLSYWPREGEDMTRARVVAPRLRHLVELRGEAELGLTVNHLVLRGLSFQYADWTSPKTAVLDGQAAIHTSAAVVATGARNCVLDDCEIAHVGEYAVILGDGCRHNRIVHCHIHDLGAGGVRVGGTGLPRQPERRSGHNVVDNCFIHDGGHVFKAGIGVWIGKSSYNTVSHNEICDFFYSGCSVGWTWGYAASSANHNVFEFNHIHDLGKGVLSDMGGIYSLGVSPGTIERNNVIHDVWSYSYGGWGLYTDEGSSEILLENNLVYNTKTGGFHQHYGKDNILRNNIFAFSRRGNIIRSRQEDHNSFTFERNLVLTDDGEPLGGKWSNGNYVMRNNLYWDVEYGRDLDFSGMSFEEWQAKGRDQGSVVADPQFVDARRRDFRLKKSSPAFKLGFRPLDLGKVGLYGDPEWVNLPKRVKAERLAFPPPEPPHAIHQDFEDLKPGATVPGATAFGTEKGASILVTDETAATGKHSLKFTDAPGLDHAWQPHLCFRPNFRRGLVHVGYALRLEPGAIFWNEWRDASSPYRVGPSIRVDENGDLKAGGKTLLTLPRGRWIQFKFVCPLGKSAGTYDLTVTVAGQVPQRFAKLPCGSARWSRLQWLGFISLATESTVFYIDDVRVEAASGADRTGRK